MLKFKEVWTILAIADFSDHAYADASFEPDDEHVIGEYYNEADALEAFAKITDVNKLNLPFDKSLVESVDIKIQYRVRPEEMPDYKKATWFNVENFKHQLEMTLDYVAGRFKNLDLTEASVKATNYKHNLEYVKALEKLDPKSYVRLSDITKISLTMDELQKDLKNRQG